MDVLDVGCGTGNATIPAAKLGARVTGLDASPGLIAQARELGHEPVHEAYLGYLEEANEADDGSFRFRGEYLVAVVDV
jgi:2-polyprenyl-3-methyl-5-hydroxy-6-metoxy-1,4-benzoquinol methylase